MSYKRETMPERIWATANGIQMRAFGGKPISRRIGGWEEGPDQPRSHEYVRADLAGAAPDLLAALKEAEIRLRGAGMIGGADDPVRAAITKATGEAA